MLKPKLLAEYDSPIAGHVKVLESWDFGTYRYISTGGVIQSGPLVKDIWAPVFQKIAHKNLAWLVLGVAGGTILKEISTHYQPSRLVGIELDPIMVKIGNQFFATDQIPHLEILIGDAQKIIPTLSPQQFDYILADMYCGEKLPDFVYTPKFTTQLSHLGRVVVFNHLYYLPAHKTAVANFISSLNPIFPHLQLVRKYANIFLICSHQPIKPRLFNFFRL